MKIGDSYWSQPELQEKNMPEQLVEDEEVDVPTFDPSIF